MCPQTVAIESSLCPMHVVVATIKIFYHNHWHYQQETSKQMQAENQQKRLYNVIDRCSSHFIADNNQVFSQQECDYVFSSKQHPAFEPKSPMKTA